MSKLRSLKIWLFLSHARFYGFLKYQLNGMEVMDDDLRVPFETQKNMFHHCLLERRFCKKIALFRKIHSFR